MKNTFLFLTAAVMLMSCNSTPRINIKGETQGSFYSISYYDKRDFSREIDSILRDVDNSVSLWNKNSIISRVNRNDSVELDRIFIGNFNVAQRAAEISGGLFDATISPLVAAWGFSYKSGEVLIDSDIDSLRQLVDYTKVRVEGNRLKKENPLSQLDFNAVAQGYTSDMIGAFLESRGVTDYIVNVGGEVLAKGTKSNGEEWIVGVERPAANQNDSPIIQTKIKLRDAAIVTSGSTRKYIERDGKRYSHSLNPHTGRPAENNLLSVSVVAKTAVWADALASVFMISGLEKSVEMLRQTDSIEACFIYWDGDSNKMEFLATKGFEKLVVK